MGGEEKGLLFLKALKSKSKRAEVVQKKEHSAVPHLVKNRKAVLEANHVDLSKPIPRHNSEDAVELIDVGLALASGDGDGDACAQRQRQADSLCKRESQWICDVVQSTARLCAEHRLGQSASASSRRGRKKKEAKCQSEGGSAKCAECDHTPSGTLKCSEVPIVKSLSAKECDSKYGGMRWWYASGDSSGTGRCRSFTEYGVAQGS